MTKVTPLKKANMANIPSHVKKPVYSQTAIKTGIVHIGVGGFHRSHQAYYIHKLLEKFKATDWGICGVGIREADRKMFEILKEQDHLYTLVIQHPDGDEDLEIIGALRDYLLAVDTPKLVLDKLAAADTKIVSLTITEGGYNFNPSTGEFNFENPDVQYDLRHPDRPKTVFGYITQALQIRRSKGLSPFTILSCDNIQHNGDVARQMFLSFAQRINPELAEWMATEVGFPNSMVDRITPVTSTSVIEHLREKHKISDQWPVVCEPFIQWVIEDKFVNGRPPLEKLGVQFVPDVTPYEKMKIRLLNAGHSVLGIPGAIHGHLTIDACMRDDVFAKFMRTFMDVEVTPVLGDIAGIDLEDYKDSLEQRFSNRNIKDSVSRICSESSAKLPKFLLPTLRENLASGGSIRYTTFIVAAWCYYSDKGVDENQNRLEIIDVDKSKLNDAASKTSENQLAFIRQQELFGKLIDNERFVETYRDCIDLVYQSKGIRKVLSSF